MTMWIEHVPYDRSEGYLRTLYDRVKGMLPSLQGERFAGCRFRHRKGALRIPEVGEAALQVERNRVVDFCANAGLLEVLAKPIAIGHSDHELIVDVIAFRRFHGQPHLGKADVGEQRAVALCVLAAARAPHLEVRQLDPQHGRLQGRVSGPDDVGTRPLLQQHPQALCLSITNGSPTQPTRLFLLQEDAVEKTSQLSGVARFNCCFGLTSPTLIHLSRTKIR